MSSIKITTDLDQEEPVDLEEYDFNMLFQVTGFKSDGTTDFNFKIPEEIGKFFAVLETTESVNSDSIFSKSYEIFDIVGIDDRPNFAEEFGISEF